MSDRPSTTPTAVGPVDADGRGLTAAEVAERVADGRVNHVPSDPSRTTSQILRANVLTPVNAIIGTLLVLIVIADGIGPDMLFGGVIVANSLIGTIQELRARAALDRLAVLNTPHAVVVRDGETAELEVEQVVADDLLVLSPGAQVVVDGEVVTSTGLELNESLLTGESDPVHKQPGDEVMSGSFVAAGSGTFRATKVGADSYAASLAGAAKEFTLVHSELRDGINMILKFLMVALPPIAIVLLVRLWGTSEDWRDALSGTVAAAVAMVPDGLVLLTSLAFMAGVVKLSRRNALLRELASVELLARVDTLCLDKTGTITTGEIVAAGVEELDGRSGAGADGAAPGDGDGPGPSVDEMLAALAASDPDPNATLLAIGRAHPDDPGWALVDTVPFSSARKWSAASFDGHGALFLGAPEFLAPGDAEVADRVGEQAALGRRVVLLATASGLTGDELPDDLHPRALVLLEDDIRDDAEDTLGYLSEQGIGLKVISGDHPGTVAAVATRAGVPDAQRVMDARDLPLDDDEALAEAVESHTVFGRVKPEQKRAMVRALQSRGHVVGMTGDGVNDVLALKDADMGIAMGAGSAASRAVAQLVLLENRFSVLPGVLAEGRRVINSVERAANLFIYGTVYSVCMALVITVVGTDYPFLPRHLTLVRSLSVGIPGFFLALAPDPRRARTGFVPRVIRFAIPAGAIAAAAALTVYFFAREVADTSLVDARSAATITLLAVGLLLLLRLTRTLPPWRWILVGSMAAGIVLVLAIPFASEFFDLVRPPETVWEAIGVTVLVAAIAVRFVPVTADGGEVVELPDRFRPPSRKERADRTPAA
ncbi:HAD-IC family P-type ATPase [Dermatobacter hominis]|uniref:HAD-IC family P-type ATPase n=1 Tax=Dermatobacter hominis TaxID=2884263 RepID=UPI001D126890|nr:HAD-IC family P-type ATPase [Dermatobacter hominis]UDY34721.1 HAD-IC family P-type ATPase [Dermatobacter hominis]